MLDNAIISYGFCFPNNKYNSVKFRVMCEEGSRSKESEEMGEVRLKKNKLSIALINSVRKATIKRYTGRNKEKLLDDQPVDCELEIYILSLCCNLLKEYYLQRFKTSVKDDRKLLEDKTLSGRQQFAIVHRLEAKETVITNMKLIELLIQILSKVSDGQDFRAAYQSKIEMLEDDANYNRNRRAIRRYLRSFHYYSQKKH